MSDWCKYLFADEIAISLVGLIGVAKFVVESLVENCPISCHQLRFYLICVGQKNKILVDKIEKTQVWTTNCVHEASLVELLILLIES